VARIIVAFMMIGVIIFEMIVVSDVITVMIVVVGTVILVVLIAGKSRLFTGPRRLLTTLPRLRALPAPRHTLSMCIRRRFLGRFRCGFFF
jgi:hypothetical protein